MTIISWPISWDIGDNKVSSKTLLLLHYLTHSPSMFRSALFPSRDTSPPLFSYSAEVSPLASRSCWLPPLYCQCTITPITNPVTPTSIFGPQRKRACPGKFWWFFIFTIRNSYFFAFFQVKVTGENTIDVFTFAWPLQFKPGIVYLMLRLHKRLTWVPSLSNGDSFELLLVSVVWDFGEKLEEEEFCEK